MVGKKVSARLQPAECKSARLKHLRSIFEHREMIPAQIEALPFFAAPAI